jgi:transposase-like protein
MSHANAALTPRARLRLARLIVDSGWSPARAAERYDVSWRTAAKWADRYRVKGEAGMNDRSSRPRRQPNTTPAPVVRKILHLRRKRRWGRSRSPINSAWPPPPCTPSWPVTGRTGSPTSTARPVNRSAVMNTTTPATCCMSTSRNSATCPTAAAGVTSAASKATATGPRHRASPVTSTTTQRSAPRSCTP